MSDVLKAALGSAAIIALGLYFAAGEIAETRYSIVASTNGATSWKLDRRSGAMSFCVFNTGCQSVGNVAPNTAQPDDWLKTWQQNQPTNSN